MRNDPLPCYRVCKLLIPMFMPYYYFITGFHLNYSFFCMWLTHRSHLLWSNKRCVILTDFFLFLFWFRANMPQGFLHVCVCFLSSEGVHECVGRLHSTHPCVLPRQIPSGVPQEGLTRGWTDKQVHIIILAFSSFRSVCSCKRLGRFWATDKIP